MGSTRLDYVDSNGIKRRVLVPADDGACPEEGIPISLPVDELYAHMPLEFRQRLVEALWAVGLIEPSDYLQRDAPERTRAALLSVVKRDTMDILNLARETMKHGN
jgi:hypothetical protein